VAGSPLPSEVRRERQIRVGRPPFGFRVSGPDDWLRLDTEPNEWQPSVQRIFANSRDGLGRLSASERRELRELLESVVIAAQETGVILTLVKLARADMQGDGPLFCGNLSLSWYESAPVEADMSFCRLVAGDAEDLEEFEGAAGPALLRCETVRHQEPWSSMFPGERAFSAQGLVPIEGTFWTALVSGMVNSTEHADLMRKLVRRMAGSIRVSASDPGGDGGPSGTPTQERGAPLSRFGTRRVIEETDQPSGMDGRWRRPLGA
jgi:hypothetical protein